jgi:hypothetical protein
MSNAVLKGNASGTGTVTLETPNTNSDLTISMPAAAGTMMVSGNMPAFSAKANASQSITTSTWTKVQLPAEDFDTASAFDSTTNYRFTPLVAGYYQINGEIRFNGTSISQLGIAIYKNGGLVSSNVFPIPSSTNQYSTQVSKLIFLNGSTDYVEMYGLVVGTSPSFDNGGNFNVSQFNGSMVRAS